MLKGLIEVRPRIGIRVRPREQWNLVDPDLLAWLCEAGVDDRFVWDLCEVRAIVGTKRAGLNRVQWDLLPTPTGRRGGGAPPGGGGGGGRGGAQAVVSPGTYLVKVTAGDRTIGQKTAAVEADTTFMR